MYKIEFGCIERKDGVEYTEENPPSFIVLVEGIYSTEETKKKIEFLTNNSGYFDGNLSNLSDETIFKAIIRDGVMEALDGRPLYDVSDGENAIKIHYWRRFAYRLTEV